MKNIFAILFLCLQAFSLTASAADKPKISTYNYAGQCMLGMSNNGKWGLLYAAEENSESAKLVNLQTRQVIDLQTEDEIKKNGKVAVADVSDDGNIIVGSYKGYPAFLNRSENKWTILPSRNLAGQCTAVTPDGRYAVGSVNDGAAESEEVVWYNNEWALMWDLTTGKEVEIPAALIPSKDPKGDQIAYFRFTAVSPDGRYLLARTLTYAEYFTVLIDRQENNYKFLGYDSKDGGKTYQSNIKNLHFIEPGNMSPDGKWVVCNGYFVEPVSNTSYAEEYGAPVRYNIETGKIEAYNRTTDDQDMFSICIDNDGNVYAGTPSGSPIREFYVRNGNYWYALRSVLNRRYGMDFLNVSALDNTGTPACVSSDGRTFISMVDPQFGQNFCLQMNESLVDICNGINLLGVYTVSPGNGSVVSNISQFKITFDREVEVIGNKEGATFAGDTSFDMYVDTKDSKSVIVIFFPTDLRNGEKYTLSIPAGTICIKGDATKTNDEITATYIGRADVPVVPTTIYPADHSVLAKLDNSSSPIFLQYPYIVNVSETASAALYTEDGNKVCNLMVSSNGNTVYITPANTQYLYSGVDYKVVLAAGSITDVAGSGGNEELTIHYSGSYEREILHDETVLFKDDFSVPASSVATWMLYDNDHNNPAEAMVAMEYDADSTPWNFSIRESTESTDFCAASHSMYTPAGKSDDWMVTPQIFIPDTLCSLTFLAQSYLKSKSDRLKVVVWECDETLTNINAETFARMSSEGELVLDELLSPGYSEENLTADWMSYMVDLKKYAGKNIYIAFVNQNDNQSMVFVDDVMVNHSMKILLALKSKQSVVNQQSMTINGTITFNSEAGIWDPEVLLLDENGEQVSRNSGGAYVTIPPTPFYKGETMDFVFRNVPLEYGEERKFVIEVQYYEGDNYVEGTERYRTSVKNLAFQPTKSVVLEEMTGTTCGNCPQGIVAIEQMEKIYGEQFIPISIHTYDGDSWGAGLSAYSAELGLRAAPSAIINRSSDICYPMAQDPETFDYVLSNGENLWMDVVAAEFDNEATVDVSGKLDFNEIDGTVSVTALVRSAMNAKNVNYNVFMVLMEDKLTSYQKNYFASEDSEVLGEWGQGGRYGKSTATGVTHNDVVRMCYGASLYGTSGLLPQNLTAGHPYLVTDFSNLVLPGTLENPKNAKIAIMLIDANTDKIVNACVVKFDATDGIDRIFFDRRNLSNSTYNLAGQKVDGSYKGIVIKNGRKYRQ